MMHGQKSVKLGRNKSLKGELSIGTTFDPPHFSLDSPFKLGKPRKPKYMLEVYKVLFLNG